jgi:hypothetical protein
LYLKKGENMDTKLVAVLARIFVGLRERELDFSLVLEALEKIPTTAKASHGSCFDHIGGDDD